MPLHLCCVAPAGADVPVGLKGVGGASVERLEVGDTAGWYCRVERRLRPELDEIRAHDAVVRAALEVGGGVVPVRFGQTLEDEAALRAHLDERGGFAAELERVRGCVEYGLRVIAAVAASPGTKTSPEDEASPEMGTGSGGAGAPSGRAYLERIARTLHAEEGGLEEARAVAARCEEAVRGLVRERIEERSKEPAGIAVAHLVQQGNATPYEAGIREAIAREERGRVVLTGPWPPYSFVR